jgi:hypothetical protein
MGHRIQVGGRDIGGLFDTAAPASPPGTPPHIGVRIKVDDAEAFIAKAASLGETTRPVMEIGEAGRMVAATDPNGAHFDVDDVDRAATVTAMASAILRDSRPFLRNHDQPRTRSEFGGDGRRRASRHSCCSRCTGS